MATYLSDTFTGADGTDLTAHTMDAGGGWTAHVGAITIQSNRASSGVASSYTADAGQADAVVTMTVNHSSMGTSNAALLRFTDTSNNWRLGLTLTSWELIETAAGSQTVRATVAGSFAVDTNHVVQVILSGDSIDVTVNGGSAGGYASATFNNTATRFGLRRGVGTATFDDFLVADSVAGHSAAKRLGGVPFAHKAGGAQSGRGVQVWEEIQRLAGWHRRPRTAYSFAG